MGQRRRMLWQATGHTMEELLFQRETRDLHEADGLQLWSESRDPRTRTNGVLGEPDHLLLLTSQIPACLLLDLQTWGSQTETGTEVPRSPLQQRIKSSGSGCTIVLSISECTVRIPTWKEDEAKHQTASVKEHPVPFLPSTQSEQPD